MGQGFSGSSFLYRGVMRPFFKIEGNHCVLLYLNLLFDIQAHNFAQQYIKKNSFSTVGVIII